MKQLNTKYLSTFGRVTELMEECAGWSKDIDSYDVEFINEVLQRHATLLADIGLPADRKYTVSEIARLKTAIEWALEGNQ